VRTISDVRAAVASTQNISIPRKKHSSIDESLREAVWNSTIRLCERCLIQHPQPWRRCAKLRSFGCLATGVDDSTTHFAFGLAAQKAISRGDVVISRLRHTSARLRWSARLRISSRRLLRIYRSPSRAERPQLSQAALIAFLRLIRANNLKWSQDGSITAFRRARPDVSPSADIVCGAGSKIEELFDQFLICRIVPSVFGACSAGS